MKDHYDFSKGKRGRVLAEPPAEPKRVRITIRLDEDLVDYFLQISDRSGGKTGHQTLINSALREYVEVERQSWKKPRGSFEKNLNETTQLEPGRLGYDDSSLLKPWFLVVTA